jgi:hypothetical protein
MTAVYSCALADRTKVGFGEELQNHRRRIGTFTHSRWAAVARWLKPDDVERDTRFELATFSLGNFRNGQTTR